MEVDYLIEKYGKYLGGIDVEKVKAALRDNSSAVAVERILGLKADGPQLSALERARLDALARRYAEEERRLRELLQEAKASGVPPAELTRLMEKIRNIRRMRKIIRSIQKRKN